MIANLKLKNIKYLFLLLKPKIILLFACIIISNSTIEFFLKNLAIATIIPYTKAGLESMKQQLPLKTVLENLYDGKLKYSLELSDFNLQFQSRKIQFNFDELAIVELFEKTGRSIKIKYLYNSEKRFDRYNEIFVIDQVIQDFQNYYTTFIIFNNQYSIITMVHIHDNYYLFARIFADHWKKTEQKLSLFVTILIFFCIIIILKGR